MPEYKDKLRAWKKENLVELGIQAFAEILEEVSHLLLRRYLTFSF